MPSGKYVFSQMVSLIPRYEFDKRVAKYQGNYRTKDLKCWSQFLYMMFGQLTHREGIRDIINCLGAHQNKLYHLGIKKLVAASSLSRANENRDWRIWAEFADYLISQVRPKYSRENNFSLELEGTVYALDASTIDLCLQLFPWAKFRKHKAAVKLHTLMDVRGDIPVFIHITDGKVHDSSKPKTYIFLTNNFELDALMIADLYKNRWRIELFFKWIKQHLKIKKFWGHSENAVKTQIWMAICTYLLVANLKKQFNLKASLYEILQILSVSIFDKTPVNQLLMKHDLQIYQNDIHNQLILFDL